jgi:hypothetical protein
LIGIRFDPFGTQGIPHNIHMRVIHRIIFVGAGSDAAEWLGVKKLSSSKRRLEHVAVSLATIQTPAADT